MEYDEKIGYGSNYEKYLLSGIFRRLIEKLKIQAVLEYPANRLMGNHEELFEGLDIKINPPTADLVWNFCEYEQSEDRDLLFKEMLNRSQKYILVITGNKRNLGVILHRLWHLMIFKSWDHGRLDLMDYKKVEKRAKRFDHLKIIKKGTFDVPWFILDVYECGRFLKKFIPHKDDMPVKPSFWERWPWFIKKYMAHHFYVLMEKI
ncbi:MAG: hypothetical protein WC528_04425 [Patescibacteria group bacterium]